MRQLRVEMHGAPARAPCAHPWPSPGFSIVTHASSQQAQAAARKTSNDKIKQLSCLCVKYEPTLAIVELSAAAKQFFLHLRAHSCSTPSTEPN